MKGLATPFGVLRRAPGKIVCSSVGLLACAALTACFHEARGSELLLRSPGSIVAVELTVPAVAPSHGPRLISTPDGELLLSWLATSIDSPQRTALRYALLDAEGFHDAAEAASGARWLLDDVDVPAVLPSASGDLLAHYRTLRPGLPLATDLRVSVTQDGGVSWTPVARLNRALGRSCNGFTSLVPDADGWVDATWMEGPSERRGGADGSAVLRWTRFHPREGIAEEGDLHHFPCPGCAPASVRAANGDLLTAFRVRRERRVRDVVLVRGRAGAWGDPVVVAEDGWPGASCIGEGPALAVRGDRVALAWLGVSRDGRPRVLTAVSHDGGRSFDEPVAVAEQMPQGRVDLTFLPDDSLLVSWLEVEREAGEWRLRRVTAEGELGRALPLAPCEDPGRAGLGRLRALGSDAVFAWTDPVRQRIRALRLEIAVDDPS